MEGQTNTRIRNEQRQRDLRRNATDAERELWRHLRSRQNDGAKFRRQHPFGNYILDFACLERRIVIELDGGQHAQSSLYDDRRSACLENAGFAVLRFWNNEIFENPDGVLETIRKAALESNPSPPRPSP